MLCFLLSCARTHGNGSKLHQRRFRLDVGQHFFIGKVVIQKNRLPRKVDAPSISVFNQIKGIGP